MTKSEILPPDSSGHSVSLLDLPTDALKGIISKLNEKTQTSTKIFTKSYSIEFSDLEELATKLRQEFTGRVKISEAISVSVHLSGGRRIDLTSWEEFKSFDTTMSERTKSISFELTVDIINSDNEEPERYNCQVSIQNNPMDFGIIIGPIGVGFGDPSSLGIPPAPIVATTKYRNYVVGKNLMSVIEGWEDGLTKTDKGIIGKIQRYSSRIPRISEYLLLSASLLLAINLPEGFNETLGVPFLDYIFILMLVSCTFYYFGSWAGKVVERSIDKYSSPLNFIFTKGDRKAQETIEKNNRRYVKHSVSMTITIVLGVFSSIIATPIIDMIWKQ